MPEFDSLSATSALWSAHQKDECVCEWALVHKGELAGLYNSFDNAWSEAALRFQRRRCIVRQISAFPLTFTTPLGHQTTNKLFQSFQRCARFTRHLFATEMPF